MTATDDEHATIVEELRERNEKLELTVELASIELMKRRRLILWLARTYGENDPIWPTTDWSGQELPEATMLAATWQEIVRGVNVSGSEEIREASETGTDPASQMKG